MDKHTKIKIIKHKKDDIWDYIIIGAGITGLYAAHRLRQHADPSARILILEAGCRVGGRMGLVDFHGVKVEPGAGIGRLEKDQALRRLLEELGIKWQEFPVSHNYSLATYDSLKKGNLARVGRQGQPIELPKPTAKLPTPDWIKKHVNKLRSVYKKKPATTTFHAFAQKVLGRTVYQQLILSLGYTDFEKEDVAETLFHYGLDDLYDKWTGMGIDWQELMDSLVEHSFADIRLNTRADQITLQQDTGILTVNTTISPIIPHNKSKQIATRTIKHNSTRQYKKTTIKNTLQKQHIQNLETSNSIGCHEPTSASGLKLNNSGKKFRARKVLIATTVGPARELVSSFLTSEGLRVPIQLSGVQSQSFLRIYGYFTGESQEIMSKYVGHTLVVPGGFHRIIPMGSANVGDKGSVYMIVYTDNRSADNLEHLRHNTPTNRHQLATGLKAALGIPNNIHLEIQDILGYYWREGTHYYTQLNQTKFGTREEFIRQLQRPYQYGNEQRLFLAGEAFSRQQGWTEGALESVDSILDDLL